MKIWQRIKAAIHKATASAKSETHGEAAKPVVYVDALTVGDLAKFREALAREFEIAAECGPEHT